MSFSLWDKCSSDEMSMCIVLKLLDIICMLHVLLICIAIYKLYKLRKMTDVSKSRFISLLIVVAEMFF